MVIFLIVFLAGCAAPHRIPTPEPTRRLTGVYHHVKQGETVFQIARAYNIEMGQIVEANRLSDADRIDVGQLLFIPGRKEVCEVLPTEGYKEDFIWPLKGEVISFYGATRVQIKKNQIKNKGIDIQAREGTTIVAAKSGHVTFAGERVKGYGRMIIIDHGDGYQTAYAHNSENLVSEGQLVKMGSPIAKVGSSGRTEVSMLHFEIRRNHKPCNPFHYLP